MRELALKSHLIAEWRRAIVKAHIQLVESDLSQQQEQTLWATASRLRIVPVPVENGTAGAIG